MYPTSIEILEPDNFPDTPVIGQAVYDSPSRSLKVWTGAAWSTMSASQQFGWYLFLDDERDPSSVGWSMSNVRVARSSREAMDIVDEQGLPDMVSFDHDLGGEDTGFKFMWHLINGHLDGKWNLTRLMEVQVHTANPVGAEKLIKLWQGFCRSNDIDVRLKRTWPSGTTP